MSRIEGRRHLTIMQCVVAPIGVAFLCTVGCATGRPFVDGESGYVVRTDPNAAEPHGAIVRAFVGYDTLPVGVETGVTTKLTPQLVQAGWYAGARLTLSEGPFEATLRGGIHLLSGEWLSDREILSFGSPSVSLAFRLYLTGDPAETGPPTRSGGGYAFALAPSPLWLPRTGLYVSLGGLFDWHLRSSGGEALAGVLVGVGCAWDAEPQPRERYRRPENRGVRDLLDPPPRGYGGGRLRK